MKVITNDIEVLQMIEQQGLQKQFCDKSQTVVAIGNYEKSVTMIVFFSHPNDSGYAAFLMDETNPQAIFETVLMLLAKLQISFDSAQLLQQIKICQN